MREKLFGHVISIMGTVFYPSDLSAGPELMATEISRETLQTCECARDDQTNCTDREAHSTIFIFSICIYTCIEYM